MAQTQCTGFVVNFRKLFTILWQGALWSWAGQYWIHTHTNKAAMVIPPLEHLQRDEYRHKWEMVWAWARNSNKTTSKSCGKCQYKQILRERPKTRHCNQEQTRNKLRVHWYIHFHWKEHFSESNWKTLKIQRPWNQSWKNVGGKSYNNSGSDQGFLVLIKKGLEKYVQQILGNIKMHELQKITELQKILGSHILRNALSIK